MSTEIRFSKQEFFLGVGVVACCFVAVVAMGTLGLLCFHEKIATTDTTSIAPPKAIAQEPAAPLPVKRVTFYKRGPAITAPDIDVTIASQFGKHLVALKRGGLVLLDKDSRPATGTIVETDTTGIIRVSQYLRGKPNGISLVHGPDFTYTDQVLDGVTTSRQYVKQDGQITTTTYLNEKIVSEVDELRDID